MLAVQRAVPDGVPFEVSAPKSGNVVEIPQSRAGSIETKCRTRVSPGSAPSTKNGPVCGFRNGKTISRDGSVSGPVIFPQKQSSVQSSSTSPGRTFITGSTPPNVHA